MNAKGWVGLSLFTGVVLAAGPCQAPQGMGAEPSSVGAPSAAALSAPLYFITNSGQTDKRALFCASAPGYTLWLTREGLTFDRVGQNGRGEPVRSVAGLKFLGVNKDIKVVAAEPSEYRVSYFFGRDESEWKTDIPTSKAVLYKNLYDGVDLKVYGAGRQVEYDWIVGPGADPARIRLAYEGGHEAKPDDEGNLVVETPAGRLLHRRPSAYQEIDGARVDVVAAFKEAGNGTFGFALGAYDPRHPLTIDPLVLAFSTYLGGNGYDYALRVATDPTGAIYVCGGTHSKDFPPVYQDFPRRDLYITKLSADGKSLVYTAFFPTSFGAEAAGLAVDQKGNVYFASGTRNAKFPVKNAFQTEFKGGECDGFVLKLARSGKSLAYSSYIGGEGDDFCNGLQVDADGSAYIVGKTYSRGFPTKRAYQPKAGGRGDAFVAKVAAEGSSLVYSTYLGGTKYEEGWDLIVGADGAVVIAGETQGSGFPLATPFQKAYGGGSTDAFVTKLSPKGNSLVYSSFLGGNSRDIALALAADANGAVYLAGVTEGGFPVKHAFQKKRAGSRDAFVARIAPDGKSVDYSSYLGGSRSDVAYDIAVDASGNAYVAGDTASRNFPLKEPLRASLSGNHDAFVSVLDASGAQLLASTFLGGRYMEMALGLALAPDASVLLCGMTNSPDFPVKYAYQKMFGGGNWDAFVLKFKPSGAGAAR